MKDCILPLFQDCFIACFAAEISTSQSTGKQAPRKSICNLSTCPFRYHFATICSPSCMPISPHKAQLDSMTDVIELVVESSNHVASSKHPVILSSSHAVVKPHHVHWLLVAESTFARRSAEVDPLSEKKREKTGWMKDRKTTWAPPVWGRAIHKTRMNLKV